MNVIPKNFISSNIILNYNKVYSTSSVVFNKTITRQRNFFGKLLKEKSDKKKWYNAVERSKPPVLSSTLGLTKGAMEGKKSINSKRIAVLNKMFMRNITDLMTTGNNSMEFFGYGIEISQVKVTPDFNEVLVYWLAKGNKDDNIVQDILSKNAAILRHELSQLKVMGVVPKITFIKDKQYAKALEVDSLLVNADFGEDYKPSNIVQRLKTDLSLNTNLSLKIKDEILKSEEFQNEPDDSLPPMKSNLFGLDHSYIMEKILKSMKKSLAIHRSEIETKKYEQNTNTSQAYPTSKTQKEAFEKFLHKRKLLERKLYRREKNYIPEKEFIQEQLQSNLITDYDEDIEDDHLKDTEY